MKELLLLGKDMSAKQMGMGTFLALAYAVICVLFGKLFFSVAAGYEFMPLEWLKKNKNWKKKNVKKVTGAIAGTWIFGMAMFWFTGIPLLRLVLKKWFGAAEEGAAEE